jgi:hypothetical protein
MIVSGISQIDSRISELASDMAPIIAGFYQISGFDKITVEDVRKRNTDRQIVARYLSMIMSDDVKERWRFRTYLDSLTQESAPPDQ